jgi:general stress protein CsbA
MMKMNCIGTKNSKDTMTVRNIYRMNKMVEKALTIICIGAGTLLTYVAGDSITYMVGYTDLVAYTAGVLIMGAGIRSVMKGK